MTLGLSMIVKNVENFLPRLLPIFEEYDQVVIVDTGSTDNTKKILSESGLANLEIHNFEWEDDFAKARNFSLSKITTDAWMWIDSDDTLPEGAVNKYKNIAKAAIRDGLTHIYLKYHYQINEVTKQVEIDQFRERIFVSTDWEWREPIHEVCCYIGEEKEVCAYITDEALAIKHMPDRSHFNDEERNWRILHKHLYTEEGTTSHRTLAYITKDALYRKQYEYCIQMGLRCLELDLPVSTRFDVLTFVGKAFRVIRNEKESRKYLNEAIALMPKFNEPIEELIALELDNKNTYAALDLTDKLNEGEVEPENRGSINNDIYHGYKYAKKADILMTTLSEPLPDALIYHMRSLDFDYLPNLCYENENKIKNYIENKNVGIIYSDLDNLDEASEFKENLLKTEEYERVYIFTDPKAVNYANKNYYHFSEKHIEEEVPLGVKVLNFGKELSNKTINYKEHHSPIDVAKAYSEKYKYCHIDTGKKTIFFTSSPTESPFYVKKGLMFGGSMDKVLRNVYRNNYLYVDPSLNKRQMDFNSDLVDCNNIATFPKNGKSVAIFAGGIQQWDGITPYSQGIGASESSVIYLAEELIMQGYTVFVFCPTNTFKIISGVTYLPTTQLTDKAKFDVFISSRAPQVLNKRYGDIQMLWMHDIAEAYKYDNIICDKLVCVSEWQQKEAAKLTNIPSIVIPNGVKYGITEDEERGGDILFISQPERGLDLVIDKYKKPKESMSVLYGFYNLMQYSNTLQTFKKIQALKNRMRKNGILSLGRQGVFKVRKLQNRFKKTYFVSDFPETFNVSCVEALACGMDVHVQTTAGATHETAKKFSKDSRQKRGKTLDKTSKYVVYSGYNGLADWDKVINYWLDAF